MKMKKSITKIGATVLAAAISCATFASCGKSSNEVKFWIRGDAIQLDMYTKLTNEFNETYGKEHGITVKASTKPNNSYEQSVQVTAGSKNGPDLFLLADNDMKQWIIGKYFCPITDYYNAITDIDMGDLMESTYSRLLYNVETNTSHSGDDLYGMPLDAQPTALYYNASLLKEAGIKIISVNEEDMDKWNADEIADRNGVKKSDLGIAADHYIPKKGFYRSENPYYYAGDRTMDWISPTDTEIMVFNNRIAMNWDEIEDLAMLFTGAYNPNSKTMNETSDDKKVTDFGTTYGYFTEWWFNYGWSVGGDCLQDLTDQGEWNFSLLDSNPNYIVKEGKMFAGRTGKVYAAGETLEFVDKMNLADGEIPTAKNDGDYYHANGKKVGIWTGVQEEMQKTDGALAELASTQDAFKRYLKLGASRSADIDGDNGLNISPNPNTINVRGVMNWFVSGELALAANTSAYMASVSEQAKKRGFEWDVAPLAIYKQYNDPTDPQNDTVAVKGKQAGHSNAVSVVVRTDSEKKEQAVAFIKWCAGVPGQTMRASLGFFPNQRSLIDKVTFDKGIAPKNATVFSEALEYQGPGDWWYMPDHVWVEKWCTDLNAYLRNGQMTYKEWFEGTHAYSVDKLPVVQRTNAYLQQYKKYGR